MPQAREKKDCMKLVETALSTQESIELQVLACQRDLQWLAEGKHSPRSLMAEIEEMLGGQNYDGHPAQMQSPVTPSPLSPRIFRFDSKLEIVHCDKATQADTVSGDQSYLESLERRHYVYMQETFRSLRFSLEIFSPVEIKFPKRSKPVPEINSML